VPARRRKSIANLVSLEKPFAKDIRNSLLACIHILQPSMKEASARIKINKLLEAASWRFFADANGPANIQLEPSDNGIA